MAMLGPGASRRQQLTAELHAERSPRELRLVRRKRERNGNIVKCATFECKGGDDGRGFSRRRFIGVGSAALAAAAGLQIAEGQEQKVPRSPDHHLPNETEPGPNNTALDKQNPSSVWPPETDAGGQPPFKYSFSLSHKRIEEGGWTRQVTVRDLPISKKMAGVEMRLVTGGIRELHWHVGAEWALMLYGNARITAVDQEGRSSCERRERG